LTRRPRRCCERAAGHPGELVTFPLFLIAAEGIVADEAQGRTAFDQVF
jgi:hypothetical protein